MTPPIKAAIQRWRGMPGPVSASIARTHAHGVRRRRQEEVNTECCTSRTCVCLRMPSSIRASRWHTLSRKRGLAVDDVLPALDTLISTLLGWRTIQPGLNPLRPDGFVRALQSCLQAFMCRNAAGPRRADRAGRRPAGHERRGYRELSGLPSLLRRGAGGSARRRGPEGRRRQRHAGGGFGVQDPADAGPAAQAAGRRLRRAGRARISSTRCPASMAMLQDMKQVDALVQKLEQAAQAAAPTPRPPDMLAQPPAAPRPATPRWATSSARKSCA